MIYLGRLQLAVVKDELRGTRRSSRRRFAVTTICSASSVRVGLIWATLVFVLPRWLALVDGGTLDEVDAPAAVVGVTAICARTGVAASDSKAATSRGRMHGHFIGFPPR